MHYSRLAFAALPLLWTSVVADTDTSANPVLKFDANADPSTKYPFHNTNWGNSVIHNHCGSVFYLWNQGATFGTKPVKVNPGDNAWSFPLYQAGKSDPVAGPAIKIAPATADGNPPDLYSTPQPNIGQFEYTVDASGLPGKTSFDFSYVNNPGPGPWVAGGFKIVGSNDPGSIKQCKPNDSDCHHVYIHWDDDKKYGKDGPMTDTPMGNNIELTLCDGAPGTVVGGLAAPYNGGSGSSGSGSSPPAQAASSSAPAASSSAPAVVPVVQQPENKLAKADPPASPSPTPTPTPASPKANDVVTIYETETAPVAVVTVFKSNPKEKREEHLHQHVHAHAHQKIHKRRLAL